VVDVFLIALAIVILVPLAVLTLECLAALLPQRRAIPVPGVPRPCCVVVIPAHDEESGITATVSALAAQLKPGDRLLVVADNCSDDTAAMAGAAGAVVVERHDPTRRGKGFALDHGVRALERDPPEVVVFVDADCLPGEGAIDALVRAAAGGCSVQGVYLMDPPPGAGPLQRLSAFAFQLKNEVRPLGLRRLGCPCLLTGAGMALPWALAVRAPLATGDLVEDMRLGIDLALAGAPPELVPEARVTSVLPCGRRTAARQRTRWEHGHLRTLLTWVPRLLGAALIRRQPRLLGLALELCVPPLSLLFLAWAVALAASFAWWWPGGSLAPVLMLGGGGLAAILALFAAWVRFGQERLPFRTLLVAPLYVCLKLPLYLTFLVSPQRTWVRTDRSPSPSKSSDSS
jgi:cellulose synthase/poly-beta-1,6-N-acetylglucosamine synthase-like glycosyltransferase